MTCLHSIENSEEGVRMNENDYAALNDAQRRRLIRTMTALVIAEWRRGNFMGAAAEATVEWSEKVLVNPEQGYAVLSEAYFELDSIPLKAPQTAVFCNAWKNGKILRWARGMDAAPANESQ